MTSLKDLISQSSPLVAPSVYDGISARLVQELGFQAAYIGSYASGATKYGLPDIGFIGLEDMVDQVRRLAPLVDVPVIADAEGGWGNPLHVARAVQQLERAGAAAIHLEDHVFGKHLSAHPELLPVGQAVDKIKAALDARTSEDFLIIGRTDAAYGAGPDEAVDRVLAFQEAGADGLFVAGFLGGEHAARLKAEARVPLYTVNLPGQSTADLAAKGADVVLYFALAHVAALRGMRAALESLAKDGAVEEDFQSVIDFDTFLGVEQAREKAQAYGLLG